MSDLEPVATAQRTFWNSDATRRWVTEQARIDRLMAEVTAAAAPKPGRVFWTLNVELAPQLLNKPNGHVLGIDISEQQFGLARQRVAADGERS